MEDNFEELERVYDERYARQHGRWRPIIRRVIHEFLDCGDLRHGCVLVQIGRTDELTLSETDTGGRFAN